MKVYWLPLLALTVGCAAAAPADEVAGEACPGVTVIDGTDVVVTGSSLSFPRAGNDEIAALEPGHILVSGQGEGLLRTVVAVTERGDQIVVDTEPASLLDTECEGDVAGSFGSGSGSGGGDESADFLGATIKTGKLGLVADENARAFVDVDTWADLDTDFELTGKIGFYPWARATFKFCPSGGMTIDASIAGLFSGTVLHNVYQQKFAAWSFPVPTPFGVPIPVVIIPSVAAGVGAVVSTNGPVDFDGEYRFHGCIEFSAYWDTSLALPLFSATHSFKFEEVRSVANASNDYTVRLFLNAPDMKLCLYGALCVALAVQPYVELRGSHATGQSAVCGGLRLHPRFTASVPLFSGATGGVTYAPTSPIQVIREKITGNGECTSSPMELSPDEVPPSPDGT